MKKITLLLVMLLAVVGVNAKTKTTTLWEKTYTGGNIEIPVADLVSGATITVYTTVEASDTPDNRKLRIFYTDAGWNQTSLPGVSDWVELTAGQESYSFTLTSSAYNILYDNTKSHQILYIGANNKDYLTITKITQTETLTPKSTGDDLLSEDWESSKETAKILSAVSDARIGDVLQFTVSPKEGEWKWVQFKLTDKDGNVDQFTGEGSEPQGSNGNTSFTLEFIISNLHDLKKIKNDGFGVIQTGENAFTMTAVNLLTYSDSYGYITIPIPEVGYATWSSDKKYDFKSAGLQAYYASDVTTGSVTLAPMDITWDYQGYIIKGSAGAHDVLESLTTDGSYYPSGNLLVGAVGGARVFRSVFTGYEFEEGDFYFSDDADKAAKENIIKTKYRYIFAKNNNNDEYGFYKLATDYERTVDETKVYYHELGDHKAYLETAENIAPTPGARVALIFDDGETTGVKEVKGLKAETKGEYYDLMGRKVAHPTRGLYIVNGKKVIIK